MAGRRRMGFRQPHVQRHETRFGAESDQTEKEEQTLSFLICENDAAKVDEIHGAAGFAREQPEQQKQENNTDVRSDQIDQSGLLRLRLFILKGDEEKSGQGHDLPGDDEQ
ncbi:MAG: hypothetical protein BWY83_03250 [bacterium ADurb.Bin478]|nr:MAG: hypothetical protein BWY83_03250 [bacterium ADurb.Bin478]